MNEIEKAIDVLLEHKRSINVLTSYKYSPLAISHSIELAIQALQEKAEREMGCDYCNNHKPLLALYSEYSIEVDDREISVWRGLKCEETFEISYCPMCGRKLVE